MIPSTINGTELGAQEWRDSLFQRYDINSLDLPSHCDGCGTAFTICHALDFKKVSLITASHNKLRNGVADLAGKAFTPAHVVYDPKIFTVHAVRGEKAKAKVKAAVEVKEAPPPEEGGEKGDLLIRDIWTQGADSIHDMRAVNTGAVSYHSKTP